MPRNKPAKPRDTATPEASGLAAARTGTGAGIGLAAVGLAILDASAGQARPKTIEGVRLPENAIPATSGDHYQDGRALLAAGDTPGAIAAFRAALVDAPQSIDALNGIAVAYDRMGRYDVSRSYYDTALAIDPNAAMVLNNLGYSLYLQGQYTAAIPLLQKAAASNDNGARSTGQRVLTLIAARMRETAIASADTQTEMAEAVAPPQARIEISSNGEQRLVLRAPAPPRELTASLGDAAAQTMVARPWTARDEARDEMAQLAEAISAARAERAAAALAAAQQYAATPQAGLSVAVPSGKSLPTRPLPGDAPSAPVLANVLAPAPKSARAANQAVVALYVDETPAPGGAAPGHDSDATPATRSTEATTLDAASAWLLAPRRNARPAEASTVVGHEPQADAHRTAFDSDDGDLNAFASRMRGVEPSAGTGVSTEEAVARLESLILRLRAA